MKATYDEQGMNFLAGVLLMYLPQEEDAYSALVLLMQHRKLRELYKEDLAMLQVQPCTRFAAVDHHIACCSRRSDFVPGNHL